MVHAQVKHVHVAPRFFKSFERLPASIQRLATEKDALFRANPSDPRLRTHKLKGALEGAWAYSVNYQYRVLFRFLSGDEVLYYDIGTHDIYR